MLIRYLVITPSTSSGTAAPHGQTATLAVPQLGACASSGRAWWRWAARHSQEEARPLGSQPPPRVLKQAASRASDIVTFDHACIPYEEQLLLPNPNPSPNPTPNQASRMRSSCCCVSSATSTGATATVPPSASRAWPGPSARRTRATLLATRAIHP